MRRKPLFLFFSAICILIFLIIYNIFSYSENAEKSKSLYEQKSFEVEMLCELSPEESHKNYNYKDCYNISSHTKNILLWGDSHATHLSYGLRRVFGDKNFIHASASACPPVLDVYMKNRPNCKKFNEFVFNNLINKKIDLIILSADWSNLFRNHGHLDSIKKIKNTIKKLKEKNVELIFIGQSPVFDINIQFKYNKYLKNNSDETSIKSSYYSQFDKIIKSVSLSEDVAFYSPYDFLCEVNKKNDEICKYRIENYFLFWDSRHFTKKGALFVAEDFYNKIKNKK